MRPNLGVYMRLRNLIILSLAWWAPAHAADENSQFAIKGMGLATCERFVEARTNQSDQYFQFGGWLNGYLSALNRYEAQTFDIAPWQSTGMLSVWLANFCEKNPDVQFIRAVTLIVNTLGEQRLTTRSDRIEARDDEAIIIIYEATLRDVQERLTELDYYGEPINGQFDLQTREALEKYQQDLGLRETGLPDQATLLKLFYPESKAED